MEESTIKVETATEEIIQKSVDPETYGSFFVGKMEVAINVKDIQEVVNFPEQIVAMPLSPDFLLGVFNLRGMIIPIINLKALLKHEECGSLPSQKVAILEYQGANIGILFDSTSEIIRVARNEISDFTYSSKTVHKVISGAIKLEGGSRILQIIEPFSLISIANIPQILEQQKRNPKRKTHIGYQHENLKKCISFKVLDMKMAFDISGINEIVKVPEIQHSAMETELCKGIINLRGQTVPVIDFAVLLNVSGDSQRSIQDKRIIILRLGEELFGLLVDSVESISSYLLNEIMAIPLLSQDRAKMFEGCISVKDEGEVILLNHEHVLSRKEVLEITQGHSKIYKSENSQQMKKRKGARREAYISFKLEHLFGVSICDIREIINYSNEMLNAPGMPTFVNGMMNLRGQLVTIIDTRKLYSMKPSEAASSESKILIFENGDEKFGLVVDSVESIISIDEENKMKLPSMVSQGATSKFENDVKEVVSIPTGDDRESAIIILNMEPVTKRIKKALAA